MSVRTVAIFIASIFLAQQPAPQPSQQGVIRINVDLVQVDAIVTDKDGRPVSDLTAADFQVIQDGKPQTITNFAYVNSKDFNVTAAPARSRDPRKTTSMPLPPEPLRPEQIRRTIAVVVDDLGLSFEGTVHARDALQKWIDEEMRPGDLVAVIRTSAGIGALQQFTSDKRILYAALKLIRYHVGRVGLSSFDPMVPPASGIARRPDLSTYGTGPAGTPNSAAFESQVEQTYLMGTIGAIRYVLEGLRDMPGRKTLILFSENMRRAYLEGGLPSSSGAGRFIDDRLKGLTDAANRSSVVIHAIDTRGLMFTGLAAEDNTQGARPEQVTNLSNSRSQQLFSTQDGLLALTETTGGVFIRSNNDIVGALRQVVNDGDSYYLIGYQPDAATFEAKAGGRKFHNISVRVKRPGVHVRSRAGFIGASDDELHATASSDRETQIARALASPFAGGDLHVRLTSLFSYSDKEGPSINALLYFDANDLAFVPESDGWRKANFNIVAGTVDTDGRLVDSVDQTWSFRVPEETYREVLKRGIAYSSHVTVKRPGAYQLRIVLRDAVSRQLGSASQFIEVPDVRNGRLTMSDIVVHAEDRQPDANTDSQQVPRAGDDPNGTPAVRIFKPGAAIAYVYEILNARTGPDKKIQLEEQIQLFRDGRQVYSGTPSPVSAGDQNPRRLVEAGHIQLRQTPPGQYMLQVTITDKLAKEKDKDRVAVRYADFEIR